MARAGFAMTSRRRFLAGRLRKKRRYESILMDFQALRRGGISQVSIQHLNTMTVLSKWRTVGVKNLLWRHYYDGANFF